MLLYLLKFSACLVLFLAYYKVFLEKESMHRFKRAFLLFSIAASSVIPLITFVTYAEIIPVSTAGFDADIPQVSNVLSPIQTEINDYWPIFGWSIYGLGFLIFGLKFTFNLSAIFSKINRNTREQKPPFTIVLLTKAIAPHTFLRYTFYNKQKYTNDEIPKEIIWHEESHARQLHSVDILIIELLQVVLWFNPLIYLTRNCMKLNHEFLADTEVLKQGIAPGQYQKLLLTFSTKRPQLNLANAINYSLIKKRFSIMKKRSSKGTIIFRNGMVIPLVALTIYGFSTKSVKTKTSDTNRIAHVTTIENRTLDKVNEIQDVLAEYNQLATHYSTYPKTDFVVKVKDMLKIRKLYNQLSNKQRSKSVAYPKSTSSMTIFISNDGKYLIDEKEVSLESIAATLQKLSAEELSNAYVFKSMDNMNSYIKKRGAMNRSNVPPNDTYITVLSKEVISNQDFLKSTKTKPRIVDYAAKNNKLTSYLAKLSDMLESNGAQVNY